MRSLLCIDTKLAPASAGSHSGWNTIRDRWICLEPEVSSTMLYQNLRIIGQKDISQASSSGEMCWMDHVDPMSRQITEDNLLVQIWH